MVSSLPLYQCHTLLQSPSGLAGALFMAGLVGSVSHCAGMCGPFVISQATAKLDSMPMGGVSEFRRLQGAALLPYHAGRLTTYAALGVAAAAMTSPFRDAAWFHVFSAVLLTIAGLFFLGSALKLSRWLTVPLGMPSFITGFAKNLFTAPFGWRGYALGMLLGFLPCGLVYAAIMAAAAHGNPATAAAGMLAFGLGTVPALIAVGFAGRYVFARWHNAMRYAYPSLMVLSSLVLFIMAGELIP